MRGLLPPSVQHQAMECEEKCGYSLCDISGDGAGGGQPKTIRSFKTSKYSKCFLRCSEVLPSVGLVSVARDLNR